MSIWTSETLFGVNRFGLVVALMLALPLAGCIGEGTGEEGIEFRTPAEKAKPVSGEILSNVPLYNGRVVVAGPKGYCIDGSVLRRGGVGSVVLIASCNTLSGKPGGSVDPAVMTVSVSPRQLGAKQPNANELSALAAPAKVLASEDGDGISLVRMASGGDSVLAHGDPRYWRAGMLINGHVVSLAAYTPKGSGTSGKALIMALAETLRELSPVKDYTPSADAE